MREPHAHVPYPGDLDDASVARSMRWGVVVGVPTVFVLVTVVGLLAGLGLFTAVAVAAWPAIVAGGYFGTLGVVDYAQHQHPVGEVRALLHPLHGHHPLHGRRPHRPHHPARHRHAA
ncbi:MAG: hypothetical protein AB1673_15505 [Actinomycetota bacterium]